MRVLVITQAVDESHELLGFFVEWLRRLGERVDSLDVIALSARTESLGGNVRVHSLGKTSGRGRFARQVLLQQRLMEGLLRENPADLIFCHMCPEYAVASFPLARLARKPIFLWYTHGADSVRLRLAYAAAARVLTASADGFPFAGAKVIATGHGIDLEHFRPTPLPDSGPRRILTTVGRISPVKGYEVLIRALGILVRELGWPNTELRIVGGVPLPSQQEYRNALLRLTREEDLGDHIRFLGPLPYSSIPAHLADAEVFVSASRTGSLDKAPLEALASGRPVVCSSGAFAPELAGLEESLLFRQDDPADLAEKLARLLAADRGTLQAMADRLTAHVRRRHDLNDLVNRMIEILTHDT